MARVWEENFAVRVLPVSSSVFTDVADSFVPIDCNTVVIINPSAIAMALRSDPANANSEVTIGPGQQFEIGGPRPRAFSPARFQSGNAVCSLKAASGSPSALIVSTR
jgi:hypothetical protein